MRLDCVPFPAPGGPRRITGPIFRAVSLTGCSADSLTIELDSLTRISRRGHTVPLRANQIYKYRELLETPLESPRPASANPAALRRKSIVVPHDQLRFDLGDRIHRHADHDEQRCAAEVEIHP